MRGRRRGRGGKKNNEGKGRERERKKERKKRKEKKARENERGRAERNSIKDMALLFGVPTVAPLSITPATPPLFPSKHFRYFSFFFFFLFLLSSRHPISLLGIPSARPFSQCIFELRRIFSNGKLFFLCSVFLENAAIGFINLKRKRLE